MIPPNVETPARASSPPIIILILFLALTVPARAAIETVSDDPWLWLEEVDGINALAWVNGQNLRTAAELKSKPEFESLYKQALETLNSESRIPSIAQRGKWLYNLWRDANHPRGVYRRTTVEEFRKTEPEWETVLDIDALSQKETKQWVFHSMDCLEPKYRHCLVSLAPGGTDASEIREFDMEKLAFVADGFSVPSSKSYASWLDENTLFLGLDAGPGSVTESGYPRTVKIWKRGTPLAGAQTIYEGNVKSVSSSAYRIRSDAGNIDLVTEGTSYWTRSYNQWIDGKLQKLNLPESAVVEGGFRGKLVISLKEDWTISGENFTEGSVIIADPEALREDAGKMPETHNAGWKPALHNTALRCWRPQPARSLKASSLQSRQFWLKLSTMFRAGFIATSWRKTHGNGIRFLFPTMAQSTFPVSMTNREISLCSSNHSQLHRRFTSFRLTI